MPMHRHSRCSLTPLFCHRTVNSFDDRHWIEPAGSTESALVFTGWTRQILPSRPLCVMARLSRSRAGRRVVADLDVSRDLVCHVVMSAVIVGHVFAWDLRVAPVSFRHERDGLCDDLMLTAFLSVFRFPPSLL